MGLYAPACLLSLMMPQSTLYSICILYTLPTYLFLLLLSPLAIFSYCFLLTYSTIEPATFPWHDQFPPQHVMSQQQKAIAIHEGGRLDIALSAYTTDQFKEPATRCCSLQRSTLEALWSAPRNHLLISNSIELPEAHYNWRADDCLIYPRPRFARIRDPAVWGGRYGRSTTRRTRWWACRQALGLSAS
jgi:hypothetical protein